MPRTILEDIQVELKPNEEWVSPPVKLAQGETVELDAVGTTRFYLTLVTSDYYDTHPHAPGLPFEFPFGTDRTAHLRSFEIERSAYYRVVARISMWNYPGKLRINLRSEGQ